MANKDKGGLNHLYTLLYQHEEEGKKALTLPRVTDEHSTGDAMIDEYLGGGYGRKENYEIVLIFGGTGVSKSTFTTQMIIDPALKGRQIAYFSLEDDVTDLYTRLFYQISGIAGKFGNVDEMMKTVTQNIMVAPESDGYTLGEMSSEVEKLFNMGIDIIVIDPLQFIFEASVVEKSETEFNRQRLFMRQINNLIKRAVKQSGRSKTIILVSHTNKGKFDDAIDTIMGSGAIKQVPTKIVQVVRDKDGGRFLRLHKTRFTRHRIGNHEVTLDTQSMLIRTRPGLRQII